MNLLKVLFITVIMSGFAGTVAAEKDGYIGEISIFAGDFAPRNHAFCDGQELSIPMYSSLYSIIGIKYGGDGKTSFALPNLKDAEKLLKGARYIIKTHGRYPFRE